MTQARHCEYAVTYSDFLRSMRAYRRYFRPAAVHYNLNVWTLPLIAGTVALASVSAFVPGLPYVPRALWPFGCFCLLVAAGLPLVYRARLRASFRMRGSLAGDRPVQLEFDAAGLRLTLPERADIRYAWAAITAYFEDDQVAVLFMQEASFHTLPKRAMDEEGWARLRSYLLPHAKEICC